MTDLNITPSSLQGFIEKSEVKPTDKFTLQHAPTNNSGYSVGGLQTDFSKQKIRRDQLVSFLESATNISVPELENIKTALSNEGAPDALSDDTIKAIDAALKTQEGRNLVKGFDRAQLNDVIKRTKEVVESAMLNPRYKTDPVFRNTISSAAFQALVGSNINQYGKPARLKAFMEGKTVEIEDHKVELRVNQPFTIESFFEYESNYAMVSSPVIGGAKIMRDRRAEEINNLKDIGELTAQQAEQLGQAANQAYRPTAYKIADQHLRIAGIDTSQLTDAMALAYHSQGIPPEEAGLNIVEQMTEGGYGPLAAAQGMTVRESKVLGAVKNGEDISQLDLPESLQISAGYYRAALKSGLAPDKALGYALEIEANSRNYTQATAPAAVGPGKNKQAAITRGNLLTLGQGDTPFGSGSFQVASNSMAGLFDAAQSQPQAARPNSITVKAGETLSEIAF